MSDWIIIVDEDLENLKAAENILSEAGKHVTTLNSAAELPDVIQANGLPDMILMDISTPEQNGFNVLQQLEKDNPAGKDIPVIFLTDDEHQTLETKGFESGGMDFIKKPYNPEVLVSRVQRSLDIQNRLRKYEKDAETDPLTGFLNKTASEKKISALCRQYDGFLLMLDLDAFKSINDICGHDTGDRILIMFARILRECLKDYEAEFGRIGGDEFIVFVRDMRTEDDLLLFTETINKVYRSEARELTSGRLPIPVGVSVGAVSIPEYSRDYEILFHLADQALYFVKQNGKHGCKLYNSKDQTIRKNHRYLDLETITAILEERNASPNAMWMGNEVFGSIYRYMVRYMDRYHSIAYRVLFTVKTDSDIDEVQNAEIMIQFRKMMQNSLRNSDVMMDCGDNQLFLLLPEVQEYDIEQIINRLIRNWNKSEYAAKTKVTYEAGQVHSNLHPEKEIRTDQSIWVIIVDDDEVNLEIAANILREHHMMVTTLKSGQELIDMVKEHKPDLILLDLYMPEMDGFETLRRLRNEADIYNEVPVIFLTGDEDYETEVRCLKLGAMDFIKKPYVPEVLTVRVNHTVELNRLQKNLAATVHRKTQENENLSMHVVHSLTEAIDAKDKYTNSHSTHVAEYAKEIARRRGYTETHQEDIYMMGLLHDIGKIGIPDAVINKPGKLTEAEYELIKRHPVVGAKILQSIEEMPSLYIGARWHHERYDGKGYPDGLAGDDIPEEARIISLADAYDAMTSKRSYRDALPQKTVRNEIKKGVGTQFDPELAAILLRMIDEDSEYKMRDI